MASNDDRSSKSIWENLESAQEPEQEPEESEHDPSELAGSDAQTKPEGENVTKLPPKPPNKYIAYAVDAKTLKAQGAMVLFPGLKRVIPKWESTNNNIAQCIYKAAPEQAVVIAQKDRVPYFIAGTLKEAELKEGGCKELGVKPGTVGKQRSLAHIASLGPLVTLDDDHDVFARMPKLQALGWYAVIYSSWSYMHPDPRGRVILLLNRTLSPDEYRLVWDAINQLLGGGFDEAGQSTAQCYGIYARRSEDAPSRREILQGGALDADALIEFGRSLQPQHPEKPTSTGGYEHRGLAEEIERIKLMGAVRPPDDYEDWFPAAAAFKRAYPDNEESAFQCFDVWSACSPEYKNTEDARRKFDKVPKDHDGPELTVGIMYARARRRALMVLNTLYPAQLGEIVIAEAFKNRPVKNLGEGIDPGKPAKGDEPIEPGSIGPDDGRVALEFLLFCFGESSEALIKEIPIPAHVLAKARELTQARRKNIDLGGRVLFHWDDKNIAGSSRSLAAAFLTSGASVFKVDKLTVRVSSPSSDPAVADRIRKIYGYTGPAGAKEDPARKVSVCLTPIFPSDPEVLRELIDERLVTEIRVNLGTRSNPIWVNRVKALTFTAKDGQGPDWAVLKALIKKTLWELAPEIRGVISAPIMGSLPKSIKLEDLLRTDTDKLITQPGFDTATGLYFAPNKQPVDVPAEPTSEQARAAADLLRQPFQDFPFASPGEDLDSEVSRSVVIFGLIIGANRKVLPIAPSFGLTSHGKGVAHGKTLVGAIIISAATGNEAVPVALSPDFGEQDKQIMSYLLESDGSLFLDNLAIGTRFDSTTLNKISTRPRFKGRILGASKPIEVETRVMIVITANSLNPAGDIASRLLTAWLESDLERPQARSSDDFKITAPDEWMVEHRQEVVAAVHTGVRAYLQECRRLGGTPPEVVARRSDPGSRFNNAVDVLRDAFLWLFPDLPDPFLGFKASEQASSTHEDSAGVLHLLDQRMVDLATQRPVPARVEAQLESLRVKFLQRWKHMTPARRQRWSSPPSEAQDEAWRCALEPRLRRRYWRSEIRAGRVVFSSSEILMGTEHSELHSTLQGVVSRGTPLNSQSLGTWLRTHLVRAPIDGLRLCSVPKKNTRHFWIERADKKIASRKQE